MKPDKDILQKLFEDPDWILLKKYGNSLENLLEKYGDKPIPVKTAANALGIDELELEEKYQEIVLKLRDIMKVEEK